MITQTLTEIRALQQQALKELIEEAGSNIHLARMIEVPISTVNSWVSRGRISRRGAQLVQDNSRFSDKFPISKLRPETNL